MLVRRCRGAVRWRWAAAAVGLAALAGLILPLFSVHIGLPRATSLAASGPARAGLDTLLADEVPPGVLTPIEVLSTGGTDVLASLLHGCLGFMRPRRHPARTTRPTAPP